jgi:predicted PurR-regulated permease PerM
MPNAARTPVTDHSGPRLIARVGVSLPTAFALVFAFGATVLLLEIAHDAQRVIAWALSAMAVAALISPVVSWLGHFRFIPRAVAVLLTALVLLGAASFVGYRIVHDVGDAMTSLQEAAPARAADLEKNSDFFREIKLKTRVQKLVDTIPQRLAGGETTQVIKSALTRTVALLAGIILTIFFILYGGSIIDGGLGLISDADRRTRFEEVIRHGSRRGLFFARVKIWQAVVEGLLAFSIARIAGVPGAAALAVWVALWSLLPVAGALIGALPIIVFAAAHSTERAIFVALAFVVIGAADWWVNRWLERRAVNPGSFLIVLAGFAGLELYGLMGALLFVFAVVLAVAIVSEIGLEEVASAISATVTEEPEGDV